MDTFFKVPDCKKIRVIIDSDANCECDDQYAIVHALKSPKIDVCGIIAAQYGMQEAASMMQSYDEIVKLCRIMDVPESLVYQGAALPLEDSSCAGNSNGIAFMIDEALKEDTRPLFILCQGALTNVASAILKCPRICKKMQLICVGGINYPKGGFEFNTLNDIHAFNAVMNSDVPVWMIPEEVYGTMQVGFYELLEKIYPYGDIGRYLVENTFRVNERMCRMISKTEAQDIYDYAVGFPAGESWSLGDSTALGLVLNGKCGKYQYVKAPNVCFDGTYTFSENAKQIRWYRSIDSRYILEDFFAKIKAYVK